MNTANIKLDLKATNGKIKYMNAVNNGPTSTGVRNSPTNFDKYAELSIPFARNHDASFFTGFGGEHTVDVHRIFKNFEADENDPASYVFGPTDNYIQRTLEAGTETFYRLGASIEHGYKYGTHPPRDFEKWARICEHIIMHYNEGWANGFEYNIQYWEIWNEPDCQNADGSNPCWQGTEEEFIEFYSTAAKHLKTRFPNLKIGGPAFGMPTGDFQDKFLKAVSDKKVPLDFYSYHRYNDKLKSMEKAILDVSKLLDSYGLGKAEKILNEWNYVKGWAGEEFQYSLDSIQGLKGSAFVAGTMCIGQALDLDMLMYYEARPCAFNGLFEQRTYKPLKTYYVFAMFRDLLKLGTYVPTEYSKDDIYTCAATNGKDYGMMLTYYNKDDSSEAKNVCIEFENNNKPVKVQYFLLDNNYEYELLREEIFTSEKFKAYIKMDLFSTYFIKIENIND